MHVFLSQLHILERSSILCQDRHQEDMSGYILATSKFNKYFHVNEDTNHSAQEHLLCFSETRAFFWESLSYMEYNLSPKYNFSNSWYLLSQKMC